MSRKEWRRNTGEYDARKNGDGQGVVLDLFPASGFVCAKDDALHLVVKPAACFEGFGLGVAGEVVEIGLEQPESLASQYRELAGERTRQAYEQSSIDGFLAQVYDEFLEGH